MIDLSEYRIEPDGSIYFRNVRVKTFLSSSGYECCRIKGKDSPAFVHRIIAETFCANPSGFNCVDHINGCKTDNRACNLEWVTFKENERRKRERNGTK